MQITGDIGVRTRDEEEFTLKTRIEGYVLQDLLSALINRARVVAKD